MNTTIRLLLYPDKGIFTKHFEEHDHQSATRHSQTEVGVRCRIQKYHGIDLVFNYTHRVVFIIQHFPCEPLTPR